MAEYQERELSSLIQLSDICIGVFITIKRNADKLQKVVETLLSKEKAKVGKIGFRTLLTIYYLQALFLFFQQG